MVPATGYETCAQFGPPDAYPVEFGNIGIFERLKVLLDLVIGLDVMPSPGRTCQAEQDGWVAGEVPGYFANQAAVHGRLYHFEFNGMTSRPQLVRQGRRKLLRRSRAGKICYQDPHAVPPWHKRNMIMSRLKRGQMDRKACERHGIVPMMAEKRDTHLGWLDRLGAEYALPLTYRDTQSAWQ